MPTDTAPTGLWTSPQLESDDLEGLRDWIRAEKVEEVECVTSDLAGIARGKVMPAAKFAREAGTRLPNSIFFATINGGYADEIGPLVHTDPDLTLVPDLSTTRAVPWASDRSVQIIHDVMGTDGAAYACAPRQLLRNVCDLFHKQGWTPVVAPELEFYLTKPNTDADYPLEPPVGRSGRQSHSNQAFSLSAIDEYDKVIELIYDYADAQSLEIDTIIQEAGAAQLEINLIHGDPLKLADEVFLFKRLIREAALRCGCHATFMARPYQDLPGSAMHVHMSVVDEKGDNIFSGSDGASTPLHDWFIGGQQRYIPAALALIAPYVNSYRRLVPGWSAPINLDWGVDNRTTGLRSPQAVPQARRIENRVVGADANPYLALAACLACGYLGMMEQISPRHIIGSETNAYARDNGLPESLLRAVEAFRVSEPLASIFGSDFVEIYAAVKYAEHAAFMRVISPWEREHLLLNV